MIQNAVKIGPSKQHNTYIYDEKEKLGSGAFAAVYKGIHEVTKEDVAIKVIKKDAKLKSDPQLMKFIQDEINIQLQLQNKYIVDLLDYIETDKNIYIIQEFCNGGTLDSVLKERKRMPEEEAVIIFRDLLTGCEQLSKKNIAHRDLKPDNILIANGNYKLADFGFADKIEKTTFSNVGTPLYMSPQQLNNQPTQKSDIWSLGVIFYQMLYGYQTTPWGHLSTFKSTEDFKRKMIGSTFLNFPEQIQTSKISKDFIFQCLQKNEQQRISWEGIFKHPLFNQQDQGQQGQNLYQQPQQQSQIQPQYQQQIIKNGNTQVYINPNNNYQQGQYNMPQPPRQQPVVVNPNQQNQQQYYQPQNYNQQQQLPLQNPQQQNQYNNRPNIQGIQGNNSSNQNKPNAQEFEQIIDCCAYCEQPFQTKQQQQQHECELSKQFSNQANI